MTTNTLGTARPPALAVHPHRDALADVAAVAPGVGAFGVALGVAITASGTGGLNGVLGAALVYGGSAQLTTVTLLGLGASAAVAVASGLVVNARVLLYGAGLEPAFRGHAPWFRWLGPAFLQDQTYLSAMARPGYPAARFPEYWLRLGLYLLAVWTGSVAAGILAGPHLPPLPHLGLVGVALFLAMLLPRLTTRPALASAAAGAATAGLLLPVVPELAVIGGAAAGVLAGTLTGRNRS